MNLYKTESYTPKWNAQSNLNGRTHYVDDDTLKFHKSRILSSRVVDQGLIFALIESCAANPDNMLRVFRYVIFDIFGTVIERPNLYGSFKSKKSAEKAMWASLNDIDAKKITLLAIERAEKNHALEMDRLRKDVAELTA